MRRKLKPLILALAVAWPLAAAAQVYSWTDAHGTVHYSQSPPPQGVKYHVVKMVGGGHLHGADSTVVPAPAPAAKSAAGDAERTAQANRSHFCSGVESNLKLLQSNTEIARMTASGKRIPLSDKDRADELKRAQAQYDTYCKK